MSLRTAMQQEAARVIEREQAAARRRAGLVDAVGARTQVRELRPFSSADENRRYRPPYPWMAT